MLAKLTGAAAVFAVTVAAAVVVFAQLVKSGYLARYRAARRSLQPHADKATEAILSHKDRRSLIIQFLLLALVLSGILAVLTYYGAPSAIYRNRVVAGVWGLFLGTPAAAAFVMKMSAPRSDR